jgi:hypothetical protein
MIENLRPGVGFYRHGEETPIDGIFFQTASILRTRLPVFSTQYCRVQPERPDGSAG